MSKATTHTHTLSLSLIDTQTRRHTDTHLRALIQRGHHVKGNHTHTHTLSLSQTRRHADTQTHTCKHSFSEGNKSKATTHTHSLSLTHRHVDTQTHRHTPASTHSARATSQGNHSHWQNFSKVSHTVISHTHFVPSPHLRISTDCASPNRPLFPSAVEFLKSQTLLCKITIHMTFENFYRTASLYYGLSVVKIFSRISQTSDSKLSLLSSIAKQLTFENFY